MIYKISTDEGKRKKYAYAVCERGTYLRRVECPNCGMWVENFSHKFGINESVALTNEYYPDFMYYTINLISEKAKEALEKEKITGWEPELINILSAEELTKEEKRDLREGGVNIKRVPINPPVYYKLHVSIGADYHEKSGIEFGEKCNICGRQKRTVSEAVGGMIAPRILKKESLNGNDLFRSIGYGNTVFCTERFKEVYEEYGLTGLEFDDVKLL